MKITNHKLKADQGEAIIPVLNSPNQAGEINPKYLIIHYTAGRGLKSSVEWFMNPAAKASAHLVIGLDGSICQVVPFNKKAWHAGVSRWNGLEGLNNYSIGIELDNPGQLKKVNNSWVSWFGREYPTNLVIEATHKHQQSPAGWHVFTELQIEACIKVSQLLVDTYNLIDILGHEDIAPFRKSDPGPAFPMDGFRSRVLGRSNDLAEFFEVNTNGSNLRIGAGTNFEIIASLPVNTRVEFIKSHLNWSYIYVISDVPELREREGWIFSPKPRNPTIINLFKLAGII